MANTVRPLPVPEGRHWALNRVAYRAFLNRCFWLVIGLFLVGGGAFIGLNAHLAHFQPIAGTLAFYSSADGDLRLAGQATTYQFFHAGDFQPALPAKIANGTWVTIWVLPGYTGIDALQIFNPQGGLAAQYTDDFFDRPAYHLRLDRLMGSLFAVWGGLVTLASLVGPPLVRRQQSRAAGGH